MAMHERLEELWQDVRYAARGLVRRPGFTAIAILTLAVGIGANTAIFSAVNAMMFRPLPFRDPDQLMNVSFEDPGRDGRPARTDLPWSWMKYRTFGEVQNQFQEHALWVQGNFSITGEDAERLSGEWVSSRYLATLGVRPAMGRGFEADGDGRYDAPKVLLISDEFWKRRFNADPRNLGKTVPVEGKSFEIVGVMPQGFTGLSGQAELFVPITTRLEGDIGPTQSWSHEFRIGGAAQVRRATGAGSGGGPALGCGNRCRVARPRTGHHAPRESGAARRRPGLATHPTLTAGAVRRGRAGAADRVREPREPAARTCCGSSPGNLHSSRAGRGTRAARATAADGKSPALAHRRRGKRARGRRRHQCPGRGEPRRDTPRAEPLGTRRRGLCLDSPRSHGVALHARRLRHGRRAVRARAGAAGDAPVDDERHQVRRTRSAGPGPPLDQRPEHARRDGGRARHRVACGLGTDAPQSRQPVAGESRVRFRESTHAETVDAARRDRPRLAAGVLRETCCGPRGPARRDGCRARGQPASRWRQ